VEVDTEMLLPDWEVDAAINRSEFKIINFNGSAKRKRLWTENVLALNDNIRDRCKWGNSASDSCTFCISEFIETHSAVYSLALY
jgi:hypothetical protein